MCSHLLIHSSVAHSVCIRLGQSWAWGLSPGPLQPPTWEAGAHQLTYSNHHHHLPGAVSAESWNPWPELQLKPGHSHVEHNYPDWHPDSCPRLTFQFGVSHNFLTYPCTLRTTGLQKDKTFPHLEKTGIFPPLWYVKEFSFYLFGLFLSLF